MLNSFKSNNRKFLTDGTKWELIINDSKIVINPDESDYNIHSEEHYPTTQYLEERTNLLNLLEPNETSSFKYMEDWDYFYYLNLKNENSSYIALPKEGTGIVIGKLSEIDLSNNLTDLQVGLYQSKLSDIKDYLLTKKYL